MCYTDDMMWTLPHVTFVNPRGAFREKLENNPKKHISSFVLFGPYKLSKIILNILNVNNK